MRHEQLHALSPFDTIKIGDIYKMAIIKITVVAFVFFSCSSDSWNNFKKNTSVLVVFNSSTKNIHVFYMFEEAEQNIIYHILSCMYLRK